MSGPEAAMPNRAMHVAETGHGRPLIFLHGWSCHGGFFAPQATAFGPDHPVLLPDLPGSPHSPCPTGALSIPALADAPHALIVGRGFPSDTLVCLTKGGP